MRHILILLLLVRVGSAQAGEAGPFRADRPSPGEMRALAAALEEQDTGSDPQRLVAAALALTLGPFGAHRLYLGTDVKVPLIYGLTFGGFGILAVLDLAHILFTKDLEPYRGNDHVFMWSEGRPQGSTPP